MTPPNEKSQAGPWKKMLISLTVLGIFLAWIGVYVYRHFHEFKDLMHIPYGYLGPLFILFTFFLWLNAELVRLALIAHEIRLRHLESMALSCSASLGNFITPFRGGLGFRIYYLKTRYNFTITNFIAQNSIVAVLILTIAAAFGFAGLILLKLEGREINVLLALYFICSFLALSFILLGVGHLPVSPAWLKGRPARLVRGWKIVSSASGLWPRLILIATLIPLTSAGINYLAMKAYGINLSLGGLLFYTGGQVHLSILNITPGALGVLEAYSVYLGETLNYSSSQALVAQGLQRLVSLSSLIVLGAWGSLRLGIKNGRRAVGQLNIY